MNFLFNFSDNILKQNLLQELEGISIYPGDVEGKTLDEYRQLEMQLHLELINACRKYISQLGILSIIGILDIVKQESIELVRATKKSFKKEEFEMDDTKKAETDAFSRQ